MSRRILIVSLGSIGRRHLRNTRALLPDAEIAAWRHRKPDAPETDVDGVTMLYSVEDALAFRPDAVIVASPASTHVATAGLFIDAGAHVFLEKPLESAFDKLDGFAARCAAGGGFVMVGYVLRFQPILRAIRTLIDDGVLGTVRTAFVQTGQYLPDWRPGSDYRDGVSAQKRLGGGVMLELSHELDYARWLFGAPESVMASVGRFSSLDMDVEDSAHILYEYADKRVAIQIDFLQRVARMGLQIIGSDATLEADLIAETGTIFSPDAPDGKPVDLPRQDNGNEVYLRQFDVFFAKSFDDYAPRFPDSRADDAFATVANATEVMRIVDAAKQSSVEGRRIDLR